MAIGYNWQYNYINIKYINCLVLYAIGQESDNCTGLVELFELNHLDPQTICLIYAILLYRNELESGSHALHIVICKLNNKTISPFAIAQHKSASVY